MDFLPPSDYVTIVFTIPETHADSMRITMSKAGAGKFGNYQFCSFSTKGTAHFMPLEGAHPSIGDIDKLETVVEERIETICHKEYLEAVVAAIKEAHPYETTVIDIFPIYKIGIKT